MLDAKLSQIELISAAMEGMPAVASTASITKTTSNSKRVKPSGDSLRAAAKVKV